MDLILSQIERAESFFFFKKKKIITFII